MIVLHKLNIYPHLGIAAAAIGLAKKTATINISRPLDCY